MVMKQLLIRKNNSSNEQRSIFDFICIIITLLVVVFIAAILLTVVFKGAPHISVMLMSKEMIFAIKMSLSTASISTFICILVAMPTTYALTSTNMPMKKLFIMVLEIPLSLPYLVLGVSLLLMCSSDLGKDFADKGIRFVFSKNGIVLSQVVVNLPFAIKVLKTGFLEVDNRMVLIARMLGATKLKSFITITLPMVKNVLIGTVLLTWSRALGEFGATLMLVGVTRMKTETLPASIYLNIATGDIDKAMGSAFVLVIISIIAHSLFQLLDSNKNANRIPIK